MTNKVKSRQGAKGKGSRWDWTGKREEAALLVAEDALTDQQIARKVGVTQRTLERWKSLPAFKTRVASLVQKIRESVEARGIANRQTRIDALNDRWERMQRVIKERAADRSFAKVPGGKTGLLVRSYKTVGSGKSLRVVEEYAVDTGLLNALLQHEKQAAIELGEWDEGPGFVFNVKGYVSGISPDDWDNGHGRESASGAGQRRKGRRAV